MSDNHPFLSSSITSLCEAHPRSSGVVYGYGTAGFRSVATILDSVILRMGMLAAVRARTIGRRGDSNETQAVGVMITASHNPEEDNGVKLVDPSGGMLSSSWEGLATQVANCEEGKVAQLLADIATQHKADFNLTPRVFVGRDTRSSSEHLRNLFVLGAEAAGALVTDFGLVTTPQLHYVVREHNNFREATLEAYYRNISEAFIKVLGDEAKYLQDSIIDCANGIGALSLTNFAKHLSQAFKFDLRNQGDGILNHDCGAEHVQKGRVLPLGIDVEKDVNKKCASIDGDADRLVFFFVDEQKNMHLMDGDKITALVASFLIQLVKTAQVKVNMGVVQTAYANGASTHYIEKTLGVPVACVPTGVKYVHHQAEEYDIGIYFEANGHGTVLFQQPAIDAFKAVSNDANASAEAKNAANQLLLLVEVVNQAIGDAISDMLLVDVILAMKHWTLADWDKMYNDLPSKQDKTRIKDRNVVKTTDAERKTTSPAGLQERIDALVAESGTLARAFVRPSGTEDVVRIYAEAQTQELANELAVKVGKVVSELCN